MNYKYGKFYYIIQLKDKTISIDIDFKDLINSKHYEISTDGVTFHSFNEKFHFIVSEHFIPKFSTT